MVRSSSTRSLASAGAAPAAGRRACPSAPGRQRSRAASTVGETLHEWRQERELARVPVPRRAMRPIGHVVQQHLALADRPRRAYQRWLEAIPGSFAREVLRQTTGQAQAIEDDPNCLAVLRPFASLIPPAQAAHKPLFDLRHAEGITGSQRQSVARATRAFEQLAAAIVSRLDTLQAESSG